MTPATSASTSAVTAPAPGAGSFDPAAASSICRMSRAACTRRRYASRERATAKPKARLDGASEGRQVAIHLPLRDLGVPGPELAGFRLDEVVDVVLAARVAEPVAQHVVALERLARLEQGA